MKNKIAKKSIKKMADKSEKKPARKPITKPRKKAASSVTFSQIEFSRALGLGRSTITNALDNGRIVLECDGRINPNKNIKFITQRARAKITTELLDAIEDKKVVESIKNYFRKIISAAKIKREQVARMQLEIDDLKINYIPMGMIKHVFKFFNDCISELSIFNDPDIQNKLSELFKNNEERITVKYIISLLETHFQEIHRDLVAELKKNPIDAQQLIEKEMEREKEKAALEDDYISVKGRGITALIDAANRAVVDANNTTAKIKAMQAVKEELQTLSKSQQILDRELCIYYFSFIEIAMQDSYLRPGQISPILKSIFMADGIKGTADLIIREITGTINNVRSNLLKEMLGDGFKKSAIPYNF